MPEQIFEEGPLSPPVTYSVSGTTPIVVRDCYAEYDGSGAGGDYVPALIFRSQAGHVIARAILDETVAAGDDAAVSWFPGVKHGAAAAAASTPLAAASILETQANYAIGTFAPVIDTFRTNAAGASVFAVDGTNLYQCNIAEKGTYLITGGWSCSSFVTELRNALITAAIAGGLNYGGTVPQQRIAGQNVAASAQSNTTTFAGLVGFNAGDSFYEYFTITKALSSVGPMGWTIQQVSKDLVA